MTTHDIKYINSANLVFKLPITVSRILLELYGPATMQSGQLTVNANCQLTLFSSSQAKRFNVNMPSTAFRLENNTQNKLEH